MTHDFSFSVFLLITDDAINCSKLQMEQQYSEFKDGRAKIFERTEFVKTFVRVRLWEPYARNA